MQPLFCARIPVAPSMLLTIWIEMGRKVVGLLDRHSRDDDSFVSRHAPWTNLTRQLPSYLLPMVDNPLEPQKVDICHVFG